MYTPGDRREKRHVCPKEAGMTIIKESDYIKYNEVDLDNVPAVTGVYVFFDKVKNRLYVGSTGAARLRETIKEHWRAGEWPDVYYFRWFQTDGENDARRIEGEWIRRYRPKYNGSQAKSTFVLFSPEPPLTC